MHYRALAQICQISLLEQLRARTQKTITVK